MQANGDQYRFLFAGLSDNVEYYIQADKAKSKHFTIHVKDFPAVKRVRIALRFPSGLDLQNVVLDPAGRYSRRGRHHGRGIGPDRPAA